MTNTHPKEKSRENLVKGKDKKVTYDVFLSFHMEDGALVNLFRGQAKNKRLSLKFRDHSIKEPSDRAWKKQGEKKIRQSSVTICLIGHKTYRSKPVNWEMRKSIELDKGVMGVYLVDGSPPLPEVLKENSITPVRWKMDEIMNEIRRVSQ